MTTATKVKPDGTDYRPNGGRNAEPVGELDPFVFVKFLIPVALPLCFHFEEKQHRRRLGHLKLRRLITG
jgi:hypothetical protein